MQSIIADIERQVKDDNTFKQVLKEIKKIGFHLLVALISLMLFLSNFIILAIAFVIVAYSTKMIYRVAKDTIYPEYTITLEEIIEDLEKDFG